MNFMASKSKSTTDQTYAMRYWPHLLGLGLLRLVSLLPWHWQLAFGRRLGQLGYWVARDRRVVVKRNLALCFPQWTHAQRDTLGWRHFESVGMGLVELGMAWWAPDRHLRGRLRIEGLEHLRAAQARGKGVILLSAHFTSIDICGRLFAPHVAMDVLYRKHQIPIIDHLMRRQRERLFQHAIPRDDIRTMIRSLREGHAIWYAPDQSYRGKHSVLAPFFGVPAPTNPGTARIAQMTGAAVVPLFMERHEEQGGYLVRLLPALDSFPQGDPVADATRINQVIEEQILRCPEQYFWLHRRFKKRSGLPEVYD